MAPTDISMRPALEKQAELLRSELLGMASFQLEKTVQPLCDVVDSMKGWMLRMESFMERAEAALGGLSLTPLVFADYSCVAPFDCARW